MIRAEISLVNLSSHSELQCVCLLSANLRSGNDHITDQMQSSVQKFNSVCRQPQASIENLQQSQIRNADYFSPGVLTADLVW